jgi:PQQ-like domain
MVYSTCGTTEILTSLIPERGGKPVNTFPETAVQSSILVIVFTATISLVDIRAQTATPKPQVLKPIVSTALIRSDRNGNLPIPSEQYAIAKGNTIYLQQKQNLVAIDGSSGRNVWKRPAPWLFTVWNKLLFTVNAQGNVTAFDLPSMKVHWQLHTKPNPQLPVQYPPPILRVLNGVLVTSGFGINEYNKNPESVMVDFGLNPETGKLLWANNFARDNAYQALDDRFISWSSREGGMRLYPPSPDVLDTRTGTVTSGSVGTPDGTNLDTLNRTWSHEELVNIDYPILPEAGDYSSPNAFIVRVRIYANTPSPKIIQDLGVLDLAPRPGCTFGSQPRTVGWGVGFLAANTHFVWLTSNDACGYRIAQITRPIWPFKVQVSFIDLPEKISLPERIALTEKNQFTPSGKLSQQQRIEILNEQPILAKLRAELEPKKLLWSSVVGDKVYAILNGNRLRVFKATTGTLEHEYSLGVPLLSKAALNVFDDSGFRAEVIGKILVCRGDFGVHFFKLP